jgi:hypothetical protein
MTTPAFSDFYKSLYYSNTYLPRVNLGEPEISNYLLDLEDKETADKIRDLISVPEVQSIFSQNLSYDLAQVNENRRVLQQQGFTFLGKKAVLDSNNNSSVAPYYNVVEHSRVPGWIIKSGASHDLQSQVFQKYSDDKNEIALYGKEDGVLRIEMANRISNVAKKFSIDVVVPKMKLVAYANQEGVTEVNKKYCIVSEKSKVLNRDETIAMIQKMEPKEQKEAAFKISTIIKKAGIVNATFENIRLTPEGKIVILDTQPIGLMVEKKPGIWNTLFGGKGSSVEKCARIGLCTLLNQTCVPIRDDSSNGKIEAVVVKSGLEVFHTHVKTEYEKVAKPKISKWKIIFSICSVGLIPVINVVVACYKRIITKKISANIKKLDQNCAEKAQKYLQEKAPEASPFKLLFTPTQKKQEALDKVRSAVQTMEKEQFIKEYQDKRSILEKNLYKHTEGVPFVSVVA